jgi:hypothetical protein
MIAYPVGDHFAFEAVDYDVVAMMRMNEILNGLIEHDDDDRLLDCCGQCTSSAWPSSSTPKYKKKKTLEVHKLQQN